MSQAAGDRKRTAVLVVHGMGSQRPLDTVRGVVDAVWRWTPENKVWFHPEPSGTDIDLTVLTTSYIPGTRKRADFHELYWAHLFSETRSVAVLLWLFELARRGPRLNPRIRYVWWGGAAYLALLLLSAAFLALQTIEKLSNAINERHALLVAPALMIIIALGFVVVLSIKEKTARLTATLAALIGKLALATVVAVVLALVLAYLFSRGCGQAGDLLLGGSALDGYPPDGLLVSGLKILTTLFLAPALAYLACKILMGPHHREPLAVIYAGSFVFFALYLVFLPVTGLTRQEVLCSGWMPWSLSSQWTAVAAWVAIAIYVVADAAFLTPYLGDAARYFRNSPANVEGRREIRRQAVDTLARLHECGKYDRIVVVAHSLGTAVAYDMLRAYFGRIRNELPDPAALGPEVGEIDGGALDRDATRAKGRIIIASMASMVEHLQARQPVGEVPKSWLVTDFVTLGSPLTHAEYLMCHEGGPAKFARDPAKDPARELANDLDRRKYEREFPTCPPQELDGDGWLTYEHKASGARRFHHGAVFGLTRWTNIYFPMSELLWGDPIGGPVAAVFGQASPRNGAPANAAPKSYVVDVEVCTRDPKTPDFFAHTLYWDMDAGRIKPEGPVGPHIAALRAAINLADT